MPLLFTPLIIINYHFYRFYQRWEGDPVGWTVRLVTLFFFINSIVLLKLLGSLSLLAPSGNYYALTLPLMAVFALANYLLVFKGNKHHEYFLEINTASKISYSIFFWLYFAITAISVTILIVNNFPGRH
jgi:hypothetical protein